MKGVRTFKDGREACDKTHVGRATYKNRIFDMWVRDQETCCLCGLHLALEEATFEHVNGRGHGGSKRDDRIEGNGVAHYYGNMAKGSMSHERYMQKPQAERIRLCHPFEQGR